MTITTGGGVTPGWCLALHRLHDGEDAEAVVEAFDNGIVIDELVDVLRKLADGEDEETGWQAQAWLADVTAARERMREPGAYARR